MASNKAYKTNTHYLSAKKASTPVTFGYELKATWTHPGKSFPEKFGLRRSYLFDNIWHVFSPHNVGAKHIGLQTLNSRQKKKILGSLATTTVTVTKTSLKKWSRAASNFIAFIPSRSIRQILAIFTGVEF